MIVCVLVGLDVLVLTVWEFTDPLKIVKYNKSLEIIVSIEYHAVCFILSFMSLRNKGLVRCLWKLSLAKSKSLAGWRITQQMYSKLYFRAKNRQHFNVKSKICIVVFLFESTI